MAATAGGIAATIVGTVDDLYRFAIRPFVVGPQAIIAADYNV